MSGKDVGLGWLFRNKRIIGQKQGIIRTGLERCRLTKAGVVVFVYYIMGAGCAQPPLLTLLGYMGWHNGVYTQFSRPTVSRPTVSRESSTTELYQGSSAVIQPSPERQCLGFNPVTDQVYSLTTCVVRGHCGVLVHPSPLSRWRSYENGGRRILCHWDFWIHRSEHLLMQICLCLVLCAVRYVGLCLVSCPPVYIAQWVEDSAQTESVMCSSPTLFFSLILGPLVCVDTLYIVWESENTKVAIFGILAREWRDNENLHVTNWQCAKCYGIYTVHVASLG